MKRLFPLAAVAIISIFSLLFAGAPLTHAIEGESILLSPTSKHYELDPGQTIRDELTIRNDGTTSYTFVVYARPYSVKDSDYEPTWDKVSDETDVYGWVKFDQTSYELAPGVEVKVPYTLTVPENANSGGHYGVIFAETQAKKDDKQSVVRQKRVGSIMYVTVKGDNHSAGQLLGASALFLQTAPPLKASSEVKNTGNVDFTDTTTMVVKDLFGREKYSLKRDLALLPNTTRNMYYEWTGGGTFGLYKVTITHVFLGKTYSSTYPVLMMPIWLMVLLGVIIASGVVYSLKQRRTKKAEAHEKSKKA